MTIFYSLITIKAYQLKFLKTKFFLNITYKFSSYFTVNILRIRYKDQPVNVVWENSRCLL
jgi:hypothetical protein